MMTNCYCSACSGFLKLHHRHHIQLTSSTTTSPAANCYITPPRHSISTHHKFTAQFIHRYLPSHITKIMSTSEPAPTVIPVEDTHADARAKAPPPPPAAAAPRPFPFLLRGNTKPGDGWKRGVGFFDFVLRLCGIAATLVAAITMATTNETLPFFTQFFQFHANYADLPALTFFVVANGIAAGYLLLSVPFSLACMVRPHAIGPRLLLFICDLVILALLTSAASSATAIVYLAHNGSSKANWVAICLQFDGFCQRISGAVVASFIAVVFFMIFVVMSGIVMRKP